MNRGIALTVAALLVATPAYAQFGLDKIKKGADIAKKADDLHFTDEEERALGRGVSENVREKFGVVQDKDVHRYVTLVGTLLANASTRPKLPWTFIVLDTDAVNAFAAPGGYVHVTKGALAMMTSESELAGVLGHEIVHVTAKHTIAALKKAAAGNLATSASGQGDRLSVLTDTMTNVVLQGFGRGEELESDRIGIALANKVGYAPNGLGSFLTKLADRNKGSAEKRGLFASHPQMQERLDRLSSQIAKDKLTATATLEARYAGHISFKPVPQSQIAVVDAGAKGLAGGSSTASQPAASTSAPKEEPKSEEPKKKKGFGLGSLAKGLGGGSEQKQAQVVGSGGARGVGDPDLDAKGGGNPALVAVTVTPTDLDAFRKEGKLA